MNKTEKKEYNGFPDLMRYLAGIGYAIAANGESDNGCDWYAYKRSGIPARRCECNSGKQGVQIVITPFLHSYAGQPLYESVTVGVRGEAGGIWWDLHAYSLDPGDVPGKLETVEKMLVSAWNALVPEKKGKKKND